MDKNFELIETQRHRAYFTEHKYEHPFPVDGSNWARLVKMRLDRDGRELAPVACLHQEGFWNWLHKFTGPLIHERRGFQRATHHWFLLNGKNFVLPWKHRTSATKADLAQELLHHLEDPESESLDYIESAWLENRREFNDLLDNADESVVDEAVEHDLLAVDQEALPLISSSSDYFAENNT